MIYKCNLTDYFHIDSNKLLPIKCHVFYSIIKLNNGLQIMEV